MDFRQMVQPNTPRPVASTPAAEAPEPKDNKNGRSPKPKDRAWFQIFTGILLVGMAILLAGTALAITRGSSGSTEHKYISSSKYQAVFLNNGQVYFGNITALTNDYVRMTNIYYLTQTTDKTDSNYSLVKLGCQQIHDPYDSMVINRSQVTFWENLQDNGKVVSSINAFKKQNPNGPDCSQVSNQTQASGASSSTQGGSSTPSTTTPAPTTTK
jgi:hypothetical protein